MSEYGNELAATYWWIHHDGTEEIPHENITVLARREGYHATTHVVLDGIGGREGECVSFDLFELLHAIGVQLWLVSTTGSRLQLLEDRSAELQQLREFYGPRRDAGS